MWTAKLGAVLCGGMLLFAVADDALAGAKPDGARAAPLRSAAQAHKPRAARAPTVAPIMAAYVPAPRRRIPPSLALRPDFSEGEWGAAMMREQLSTKDLAGASVAMNGKAKLDEARVGAALSRIRDRELQDPQALATSSLDRPLSEVGPPEKIEAPIGFDFSRFGFTITQGAN
jgi:hypothetical protein